jgi:hypothetical protein
MMPGGDAAVGRARQPKQFVDAAFLRIVKATNFRRSNGEKGEFLYTASPLTTYYPQPCFLTPPQMQRTDQFFGEEVLAYRVDKRPRKGFHWFE